MVTRTWVPRGPLSRAATAAESRPSVDLPSTERIWSPGRMPALKGWGALKWVEDEDLHGAIDELGLDGHADAVVAAVLVLAHLRVGLWIVEVGVRVERVEHAGDGAVVDGLVGVVGVHLLGVVGLDDGVDAGEGFEGVAQGGLIRGGLGGDLGQDEGAGDAAGDNEGCDGKDCATWVHGHLVRCPRNGEAGVLVRWGMGRQCVVFARSLWGGFGPSGVGRSISGWG